MKISKKRFGKLFPHISEELGKKKSIIESSKKSEKIGVMNHEQLDPLLNYTPDAIAYIRRCNSLEQAREILEYLKGRGEITHECAEHLEEQLHNKGLLSFGRKKDQGYYVTKYYHSKKSKID